MPALSNGNTCWGNRKAFNFHTEYISDSFLFDAGDVNDDLTPSTPSQNFISSNSYYGYHRIPDPPEQEDMVVDESESSGFPGDNGISSSRKRPITGDENDLAKRIKHQDILKGVIACFSKCDI